MGTEIVNESWISSLWRTSLKITLEPDKSVVGILAFEFASLMSKLVNLWRCLSDEQIVKLRIEIVNSIGVKKLVSNNDDYLLDLALVEIIQNMNSVARNVARHGKRCVDPVYHGLERLFNDLDGSDEEWCGWQYKWKKMDRKVKKMERFVAVTEQLYEEMEVLVELEQTLRRMQVSSDAKLFDFRQKVIQQRHEVRYLREMSPWVRTYDYTVRLLARSLFTIIERFKYVFGVDQVDIIEEKDESQRMSVDYLTCTHSCSALTRSSVHPSEDEPQKFYKQPLERSMSNSWAIVDKNRRSYKQRQAHCPASTLPGKHLQFKTRHLAEIGPFKACMTSGYDSPILPSYTASRNLSPTLNSAHFKKMNRMKGNDSPVFHKNRVTLAFLFNNTQKWVSKPPSTLGDASLALHYANVIILIEKLASSSNMIGLDARDDLYEMLPSSVRTALRARLRPYAKALALSVYNAALATEWNATITRILDWLSPLAHNMIRWNSARSFEKQHIVSGGNVLLVQTLDYANRAMTEETIIELLLGLNYVWRSRREVSDLVYLGEVAEVDDGGGNGRSSPIAAATEPQGGSVGCGLTG
ncbi:protein of unknown function DUF3475 [Dillenia turbinata]|uniref:DUF668 domain-containing protein n=1 Tax=Dillenia turbinata TaxID=194707 RepID=A0AAN8W794_9MAGN